MRNYLFAAVLLISFVLLTGCGKQNQPDSSRDEHAERAPESSNPKVTTNMRRAQFGNFVMTEKGAFCKEAVNSGYETLFYIDFATEQKIVFCSSPNCNHDSNACTAYIPVIEGTQVGPALLYADEKLFFVQAGAGDNSLPYIKEYDFTQEKFTSIITLTATQLIFSDIFYDDNGLYFLLSDVVDNKDTVQLVNVEFLSKNKTIVFDFSKVANDEDTIAPILLQSCVGDKFVVTKYPTDFITNSNPTYPLYMFTAQSYLPDVFTSAPLFVANNVSKFAGVTKSGKLCLVDVTQNTLTLRDLITNNEKTYIIEKADLGISTAIERFFYEEPATGIATLYVDTAEESMMFAADLDAKQFTKLSLKTSSEVRGGNHITIMGEFQDMLCVYIGDEIISSKGVAKDGTIVSSDFITSKYALISKEDYMKSIPNYRLISE